MKKIAILIFVLVSFGNSSFCQTDDHKTIDRSGDNGVVMYFFQKTEVQGSQFLKDKWLKAKVVNDLGYTFKDVSVKFDAYNNKFVFNKNDTMFELTPTATTVYVSEGNNESNTSVFKKGFAINAKINRNKFVQVLAEGKAGLVKYYLKDIEEYNEYGNATKLQRYKDQELYYFSENNQFTAVNLNKKSLETSLQSKWLQVDAFLKQNNLSGKDEKSWIAAIGYYNSLF